jgi:hypothetical protein
MTGIYRLRDTNRNIRNHEIASERRTGGMMFASPNRAAGDPVNSNRTGATKYAQESASGHARPVEPAAGPAASAMF